MSEQTASSSIITFDCPHCGAPVEIVRSVVLDVIPLKLKHAPMPQEDAAATMERMKAIRIVDLELTVRSQHCLLNDNIYTLGKLLECTETHLRSIPNLGARSVLDIKEMLNQYGLKLPGPPYRAPRKPWNWPKKEEA